MALKPDPAGAPDYTTWPIGKLEAEAERLAVERTNVRLAQNAVADTLSAARALDGLTPEQRAAFAARATVKE